MARPPQDQSFNQSKVGFPDPATPLVETDGTLSKAWFPFFRSLWVKTGSGYNGTGNATVLVSGQGDGRVEVIDAVTGASLGFLTPQKDQA